MRLAAVTYPSCRLTCDVAGTVHGEFPTWNMDGDSDHGPAGAGHGDHGSDAAGIGQPLSPAIRCGGGLTVIVVKVVVVDALVNSSSSMSLEKLTGS